MTIKVLIKRSIPRNHANELNLLFVQLRAAAMKQKGYIGGETLKRVDSPEESLVISRWQSIEDWSRWLVSTERQEYQQNIDALVGSETKFEIYEN
ncbi:conserved hypothetical protein [Desulfamplus magnetovallimortis]|uniref:ABM domain-containing protein n=1 Tax=Desulfamplus magnetovallimortis TaxID=1246637 RepID=A0A1W1HC69_9BACT|nr:antibiotic biosynthesis monooxygenase [Desulfamplus magnetovallimortis]SLM30084.1 conserved hypothetical protein [Desulfamplus magnetovallimortis]